MADTRVLVVFALLQIMFFPFHEVSAATCHASGFIHGKGRNCNKEIGLDSCCVTGKPYSRFRCSPPVSAKTPAILTVNRFENGEDEAGMTFCDMCFQRDKELVVILSSGWLRLDGMNRCNKKIRVNANGRSVLAKVVDDVTHLMAVTRNTTLSPHGPMPQQRFERFAGSVEGSQAQ